MTIFQFLNRNTNNSNPPANPNSSSAGSYQPQANPQPTQQFSTIQTRQAIANTRPVAATPSANPNPAQNLTPQQQQALAYLQSLSEEDKASFSFLNTLVSAMLGYTILDIPENDREAVIKQCVNIFSDYIFNFVEIKYGKTESLRIKAAQKYQDTNMFNKFQELGGIFEEAFESFVENLQSQTVAQTA